MKLLRRLLVIIAAAAGSAVSIGAQELDCKVEINTDQLADTRRDVFNELQQAISDYMTTTRFTGTRFGTREKIECRMFFTITGYSDDIVTGELQVQSLRPVYNSSYTSTLLNFKDEKITFPYQQGDRLVFSENTVESNLTAILDYYAYLILALDFDSFSPRGGQSYVERMSSIVQQAQATRDSGWRTFDDNRNRASIANAFTAPSTAPMRDLSYNYHRLGLDIMAVSPDKGRAEITRSLRTLDEVGQLSPLSVALTMFHDAKLDELVNIYSRGPADERKSVYDTLDNLYPTDTNRLKEIINPS